MAEPYVEQDHNPHPLEFKMPVGAIDAHMHVIGPFDRFPLSPKSKYEPFAATWQEQGRHPLQEARVLGLCGGAGNVSWHGQSRGYRRFGTHGRPSGRSRERY